VNEWRATLGSSRNRRPSDACRYSGSLRVGRRESIAIARKANAMRAITSAAVIQMLPRNTKATIISSISTTSGRITGPHDVVPPRATFIIYRDLQASSRWRRQLDSSGQPRAVRRAWSPSAMRPHGNSPSARLVPLLAHVTKDVRLEKS
jgi:hypothetical protein